LHFYLAGVINDSVETDSEHCAPPGQTVEERVGAQGFSTDVKTALVACLTGRESRRWTVGELFDRLNKLGLHCSKPAVSGALTELELEMALCPFLPWKLEEQGIEWCLVPKNDLLELLSGVRKLPVRSAENLTDEHKAILLVVMGYRRKGGVSKTRISEILSLDPSPYLDDLWKQALIYTTPGKELNWWRPTPNALLSLGLRSYSDIPELKALERYFESHDSFETDEERRAAAQPILKNAEKSGLRKRMRDLRRRASVPLSLEPFAGVEN
jgi:hypothetical protein